MSQIYCLFRHPTVLPGHKTVETTCKNNDSMSASYVLSLMNYGGRLNVVFAAKVFLRQPLQFHY